MKHPSDFCHFCCTFHCQAQKTCGQSLLSLHHQGTKAAASCYNEVINSPVSYQNI